MLRASLIALGFSIPISAAADGILTAVIVLSWLVAGRFRETAADRSRTNPVALVACLWFVVHVLGALVQHRGGDDVLRVLRKLPLSCCPDRHHDARR